MEEREEEEEEEEGEGFVQKSWAWLAWVGWVPLTQYP